MSFQTLEFSYTIHQNRSNDDIKLKSIMNLVEISLWFNEMIELVELINLSSVYCNTSSFFVVGVQNYN